MAGWDDVFGANAATVSKFEPKPSKLTEISIDQNFDEGCENVILKALSERIAHKARTTVTDDTLEQVEAVYGRPSAKGTVPDTFIDFIAYGDELYALNFALSTVLYRP